MRVHGGWRGRSQAIARREAAREALQPGLFDHVTVERLVALTHSDDPPSSFEAADRTRPNVAHHHALIVAALAAGEATCRELEQHTGLEYHAVARRMSELVRSGAVERICLVVEGEGRRVSLYRLRKPCPICGPSCTGWPHRGAKGGR